MQKQLSDTGPDGFPAWSKKRTANLDRQRCFCLSEAPQLPQATGERIRDLQLSKSITLLGGGEPGGHQGNVTQGLNHGASADIQTWQWPVASS